MDWIESREFEERLRTRLRTWAQARRVAPDASGEIQDFVLDRLREHAARVIREESTKRRGRRRTQQDALRSLDTWLDSAEQQARRRGEEPSVADLQQAYVSLFCRLWPFCSPPTRR